MRVFPNSDIVRNRSAKFLIDVGIWTLVVPVAFALREPNSHVNMLKYMGLGLPIELACLRLSRLEQSYWRTATVHDLLALGRVVGAGTVLQFLLGLYLHVNGGFPRTVPIIAGVLAFLTMGGVRLAFRIGWEERARGSTAGAKRVLLVGAGDAGSRAVREIRRHPAVGLVPVGYLDDDAGKRDLRISGTPVLGVVADLRAVAAARGIDEVLITMPSATGAQTRKVVEAARAAGLPCRILPDLAQLLSGEAEITAIRPVEVQDLLRRDPVRLDDVGLEAYIRGSVILVTGAGGSIGSEIVRQIARFEPARVVLLGRGENPLHRLERELGVTWPDLSYATVVGSVCDATKMAEVLRTHSPDIVFHAAAHKHVPMMQYNPDEAVLNNVGGTRTVAEAALVAGVGRFVNISTDKAVNPVSTMGATKYLAELVVRAVAERASEEQAFVSVRFGNVLGSRGSVVPLFEEQIRRGGPVTITDPATTRYFMTIPEASALVIQAGALANNGSVYVLDMGAPVLIVDLARDIIRLSGVDEDEIEFMFTGMRPGEKLHEELFATNERSGPTRHEKILTARAEEVPPADLLNEIQDLLAVASRRDWAGIDRELTSMVPSCDRAVSAPGWPDAPPVTHG